jgi:hypothetical protein
VPVSIPQGDPTVKFTSMHKVRLAAEILAAYVRVRRLLAHKGLPRVVASLREHGARRGSEEEDLVAGGGWRYALSVVKTLRLLPADSRCLVRSLVLLSVLARRGAKATLVIGVKSDREFGAHAWVEYKGAPLLNPGNAADGRLLEL